MTAFGRSGACSILWRFLARLKGDLSAKRVYDGVSDIYNNSL